MYGTEIARARSVFNACKQNPIRNSRVFEEVDKVGFRCFLQREEGRALPPKICTIPKVGVCSHFHRNFAYLLIVQDDVERREYGTHYSRKWQFLKQ